MENVNLFEGSPGPFLRQKKKIRACGSLKLPYKQTRNVYFFSEINKNWEGLQNNEGVLFFVVFGGFCFFFFSLSFIHFRLQWPA